MPAQTEQATFGSGCFWCTEAIFTRLNGVSSVLPGYTGGTVPNPTSEQVYSGRTGHAEVAQLTFDPGVISYEQLVEIFFATHDPTTRNRQDNDVGEQYRSAIFYNSDEQRVTAEGAKTKLEQDKVFDDPIVTEITKLTDFYPAENYHRDFFARNPDQPYCQVVISPKVAKFREQYNSLLK